MVDVTKGPLNRTRTEPGLGIPTGRVASRVNVKEAAPDEASLRADEPHTREEGEEAPPSSAVHPPARWPAEQATGTRHRQQGVTIDDVGAAAVRIAGEGLRPNAPSLAASNATIAKAPIDTRTAFILSLVDGRTSLAAIVDMSGMDADEVNAILERLVRLGLITLP